MISLNLFQILWYRWKMLMCSLFCIWLQVDIAHRMPLAIIESVPEYIKLFFIKTFYYQHLFHCNLNSFVFLENYYWIIVPDHFPNSTVTKTDFSYIFITKTIKTVLTSKWYINQCHNLLLSNSGKRKHSSMFSCKTLTGHFYADLINTAICHKYVHSCMHLT